MRLVFVPHGSRAENLAEFSEDVRSNPPMMPGGMEEMVKLWSKIGNIGQYSAIYSSLAARVLDAASIFSLRADQLPIRTMKELTMSANRDGDVVIHHPMYAEANFEIWQRNALAAAQFIFKEWQDDDGAITPCNILIPCHRPTVVGIVGRMRGIHSEAGLIELMADKDGLFREGYVVFETHNGTDFELLTPALPTAPV